MSATVAFFDRLQGKSRMLSPDINANMRFDLDLGGGQTDHWYLELCQGAIQVSRTNRPADCVVRAGSQTFEGIAAGRSSVLAALFRNDLSVEGDMRMFATLRKLLPGPPDARDPRTMIREGHQP